MLVIRFECTGAVGHIVLCNPPGNLIALALAEELRPSHASSEWDRHPGITDKGQRDAFQSGRRRRDFVGRSADSFRPMARSRRCRSRASPPSDKMPGPPVRDADISTLPNGLKKAAYYRSG